MNTVHDVLFSKISLSTRRKKMQNLLMIYPEIPTTYWSFSYSLEHTRARSSYPPLGLLTVAALVPHHYEIRLVDMNVRTLSDDDIQWADLVFISAMIVQESSFNEAVIRCRKENRTIVAGGPYPSSSHDEIRGVDHFIINECEDTLHRFFQDYENGCADRCYSGDGYPDLAASPVPRFDLIDFRNYMSMTLQFSRGCPFNCEFCDIIEMFGRTPRTKTPEQFLNELNCLYDAGFRGSLFVVDDNFIGNKKRCKELLRSIIPWQRDKDYPFHLYTEASINLAEDDELMNLMIDAGFNMVFMGIETPSEESLAEANKTQNMNTGLLEAVRKIQEKGLEVSAGFIIGFDSDPENIFQLQYDFIKNAAIPMAMVGLLMALPDTQLSRRLGKEGRMLSRSVGNNTHSTELNFITIMDREKLVRGYRDLLKKVYDPKNYFDRCSEFIERLPRRKPFKTKSSLDDIMILLRFILKQAFSGDRAHHFSFLGKIIFRHPGLFAEAARFAVMGDHLIRITRDLLELETFRDHLAEAICNLEKTACSSADATAAKRVFQAVMQYSKKSRRSAGKEFHHLSRNVRDTGRRDLNNFYRQADLVASRYSQEALR
jgi:radical SAM superfamily enzyme YgiQ (UPF0313 family)